MSRVVRDRTRPGCRRWPYDPAVIRRARGSVALAAMLAACSGTAGTPTSEPDPSLHSWVDELADEMCFDRDALRELRNMMIDDPEWSSLSPQEQWAFIASIDEYPEDC